MKIELPQELLTVLDIIRWSASQFEAAELHFGHGTDNALDEAAALALGILRLPPDLPAVWLQSRVSQAERLALEKALEARISERKPVPYILGEAWFCGLSFKVDERVLIPRSPVAELIEAGFAPWLEAESIAQVVDVGTGSGCIAIACALALPNAQVIATDISADALAVAEWNVAHHGVADQLQLLHSDLLVELPESGTIDLIISNPPYVDAAAMAALPPEYRHEPASALAAGDDGLDIVRRLLPQAAHRLNDHGILIVEIGHGAAAFEAAFPDLSVTWIDFERGGTGVFIVDAATLRNVFLTE